MVPTRQASAKRALAHRRMEGERFFRCLSKSGKAARHWFGTQQCGPANKRETNMRYMLFIHVDESRMPKSPADKGYEMLAAYGA
jgi:hypothetical protein